MFGSPFYAPPYATATRDEFAWHLVKVLPPEARICHDMPIGEPDGAADWAAFAIEVPDADGHLRRIVLQITEDTPFADGEAGRALAEQADRRLAEHVDVVIRMQAVDVRLRVADVLHLVGQWEPALLSYRGRVNLERLASADALLAHVPKDEATFVLDYAPGAPALASDDLSWQPTLPMPPLVLRRTTAAGGGDGASGDGATATPRVPPLR